MPGLLFQIKELFKVMYMTEMWVKNIHIYLSSTQPRFSCGSLCPVALSCLLALFFVKYGVSQGSLTSLTLLLLYT